MQDVVIHIGAGMWQQKAILYSKDMGFKVIAVDIDPKYKDSENIDYFILEDIKNIKKISKSCVNIISKNNLTVKGVHCVSNEAGQISAAILRDYFGLRGVSVNGAKFFTRKDMQRMGLKGNKFVKIPLYRVFKVVNSKSIDNFFREVKSLNINKVIVKPVDSAGSRGICVFRMSEGTEVLYQMAKYSMNFSSVEMIIIEEFIEGEERTIETLTINGKSKLVAATKKFKVKNTNSTVSSSLESIELSKSEIIDFESFFNYLSYKTSEDDFVGHSEFIFDSSGKYWHVESACRGPGFGVFDELIPLIYGIDSLLYSLKFETNTFNKTNIIRKEYSSALISFIPTKKGVIRSLVDLNDCANIQVCWIKEVGEQISDPKTDSDRVASVIVFNLDQSKLHIKMSRAMKKIDIDVEVDCCS
jgi:biotin carboxylase